MAERNHQLALMGRIYSGASRVLAYIGEAAEDSENAMDAIGEIYQPTDYGHGRKHDSSINKGAVRALFQRSWYHRVWVIQELALSQDAVVICGDREVSWLSIKNFVSWDHNERWLKNVPYVLSTRQTSRAGQFSEYDLVSFEQRLGATLIATRHCVSSDPRDKLYGILPLLEAQHETMTLECERLLENASGDLHETGEIRAHVAMALKRHLKIEPDYRLSTAQVYTELAAGLLRLFGLDILQEVEPPRSGTQISRLPSWAPDWSCSLRNGVPRRYGWLTVKTGHRYNMDWAGFAEKPHFEFYEHSGQRSPTTPP